MQKCSLMFAYVRICPLNWRKYVDVPQLIFLTATSQTGTGQQAAQERGNEMEEEDPERLGSLRRLRPTGGRRRSGRMTFYLCSLLDHTAAAGRRRHSRAPSRLHYGRRVEMRTLGPVDANPSCVSSFWSVQLRHESTRLQPTKVPPNNFHSHRGRAIRVFNREQCRVRR